MAADPVTKSTVDNLFNFDYDSDDPFGEKPSKAARDDSPRTAKRRADDDEKENFGLGLDEEVKITKQRKPNPKLDEARLLSRPGIPKLREIAHVGVSKKLRLKGKGHEFSDAAKLLNHFQLWLDDLYPRAKFADGLQMVEKVGHSKRMQVMRREWINESKLGFARDEFPREEVGGSEKTTAAESRANPGEENEQDDDGLFDNADDMFFPDTNKRLDPVEYGEPDDDELDALMAEAERPATQPKPQQKPADPDSEGDDDLDALLAEQNSRRAPVKIPEPAPSTNSKDDDDLDALLAKQDSRPAPEKLPELAPNTNDQNDNDDSDALLAEQELRDEIPASSWTRHPTTTEEDDLDAMFAEQEEAMAGGLSLRPA